MKNIRIDYLNRAVDGRIVSIIKKHIVGRQKKILDLGCGSGLYGKVLAKKCQELYGLDYDSVLCSKARVSGAYKKIFCRDINELDELISDIEIVFCSEVLEHIKNKDIKSTIKKIENICNKKIIITVPNPLSPHFKYDRTHVLKYNIYSFQSILNTSEKFEYKLYPLGFSEYNLQRSTFRLLNILSKNIRILSPTVLYVGKVKGSN